MIVNNVTITPETVELSYMDEDSDVRADGNIFVAHSITVARCEDYNDGIRAIEDAVYELLRDALEDYRTTAAFDPTTLLDDDEDDDELG